MAETNEQIADRLSITPETVQLHRVGRHRCVDGRQYTDCLVLDPSCTSVARYHLHPDAPAAKPGDLIRVIGLGGALGGTPEKVRTTFVMRVSEVAVRQHLNGWDCIEGVVEEPGNRRAHGRDRMIVARPHHYQVLS